jgi:hypothetical protein
VCSPLQGLTHIVPSSATVSLGNSFLPFSHLVEHWYLYAAPMQPSSLPRGLQVPSSFGARRSISHDLARFSLDLAPERRQVSRVPYPSPPMSHSPPPLNPLAPNDPRIQSANFYGSSSSSSYDAYRYHQEQQPPHQQQHHHHHSYYPHQQQTPFNTSPSSVESGSLPSALSLFGSGESGAIPAGTGPSPGRSPFVSQTVFAQPATPRRPKSHVASACVNCKKAHLACDSMSYLSFYRCWKFCGVHLCLSESTRAARLSDLPTVTYPIGIRRFEGV